MYLGLSSAARTRQFTFERAHRHTRQTHFKSKAAIPAGDRCYTGGLRSANHEHRGAVWSPAASGGGDGSDGSDGRS